MRLKTTVLKNNDNQISLLIKPSRNKNDLTLKEVCGLLLNFDNGLLKEIANDFVGPTRLKTIYETDKDIIQILKEV